MDPLSPEDEALAEEMVEEAVAGYERILSPAALARVREFLMNELVCSYDGRRRLRAAKPDPVVDSSGDVARMPAVGPKRGKLG